MQEVHTRIVSEFDIENMIDNISKLNEISSQNARSFEEIASAAEHLNRMTKNFKQKLSEFRTLK